MSPQNFADGTGFREPILASKKVFGNLDSTGNCLCLLPSLVGTVANKDCKTFIVALLDSLEIADMGVPEGNSRCGADWK